MIQIAFMKRKHKLRETIEYIESVLQKKIFDNIRRDTKTSTFEFSFERDLDKMCYTDPENVYD